MRNESIAIFQLFAATLPHNPPRGQGHWNRVRERMRMLIRIRVRGPGPVTDIT